MQTALIKLLNPVYEKLIAPINEQAREFVVGFVFIIFAAYFPFCQSDGLKYIIYTETQRQIFAAALLLIATVFSIKEPLKKISWNWSIMALLWLCGAGVVLIGLLHPIGPGYFVFGLMLLFVYPALYFVWVNRGDYERLFDIISKANVWVGLGYLAYSVLVLPTYAWEPIVSGRVRGTLLNSNLYSMVGMTVACCAMYLLYRQWESRKGRTIYLLAALAGMAGVLAGQSRASILACAGGVLFFLHFAGKTGKIDRRKVNRVFIILGILLLCAIVLFAILPGGADGEVEAPSFVERFLPNGLDLNSYSSGRIEIWRNFAQHLTMTGNDCTDIDWGELTGGSVGHAHNNFFEYGYRCGVPVACLFTLLELMALVIGGWYLFGKGAHRDYMLFCIFFVLIYLLESLVDVATIPMERYAPFFFYLLLTGMAGGKAIHGGKHGRKR